MIGWTDRYAKPDVPLLVHRGELVEQHLVQLRASADYAQEMHEHLIASGAVWDGMDGYSFADEVTATDLERIMGAPPPWLTDPETP